VADGGPFPLAFARSGVDQACALLASYCHGDADSFAEVMAEVDRDALLVLLVSCYVLMSRQAEADGETAVVAVARFCKSAQVGASQR
jgi:hypothetical protein